MEQPNQSQLPIVNCHTHIFTGDHVPPFIAKTYLFFPFYYLLHLSFIVNFFRWWNAGPARIKYTNSVKKLMGFRNRLQYIINRFGPLKLLIVLFLTLQVVFILFDWISSIFPPQESKILELFTAARNWLNSYVVLFPVTTNTFLQILLVIFVLLFVRWGRNFIFFLFKKFWSFLGMLPGPQTKEMLRRYLNIGRYAFHKDQGTILGRLKNQYPVGTAFVVLPMDMEYMGMGKIKESYRDQMKKLAELKANEKHADTLFPFVFADPRRLEAEPGYFDWQAGNGTIKLNDCFVKQFIEDAKFSGFKIYPALGYYPFDKNLLPLYKYAADNSIPVLTHCIRGTIFYRGQKLREWNRHPIFEQAIDSEIEILPDGKKRKKVICEPLLLPQMKNVDFSTNFTHPLNFLCLLEEELLRKLVATCNQKTKDVFGFTNKETPLLYNLSHLKICLGHFGGDDEWKLFFERDRDNMASQLTRQPGQGIDFGFNEDEEHEKKGKLELVWKDADWYSIICSLMLQYPNVYADISYILHNTEECLPLLKQTLAVDHEKLRRRVLFGTDFYVVRNHKSDKNMLADMLGGLTEDEFDLIARQNPREFLYNKLHGAVPDTTCNLPANYFRKQ